MAFHEISFHRPWTLFLSIGKFPEILRFRASLSIKHIKPLCLFTFSIWLTCLNCCLSSKKFWCYHGRGCQFWFITVALWGKAVGSLSLLCAGKIRIFPQSFLIFLYLFSFFLKFSLFSSSFWSSRWAGLPPPRKALVTPPAISKMN